MRLTENFTLEEFLKSSEAERKGIKNVPGEAEIANLKRLCEKVLQPIRDRFKLVIRINSGYRCQELNKLVGGVPTSQHTKGQAADIFMVGVLARDLYRNIISMPGIEYDQIILYPAFVHISYNEGHNRKNNLYAKGVKPL